MSENNASLDSTNSAPSTGSPELVRGLRLVDSTTLVIGSMIGSGIFIVSADAARLLSSPGLLILAWILTAVLTIIGALCYGELAAAMPRAGGQYVYLREAFGPLFGFLYGWTTFLVIQTGSIAAVAVAFAKFLGVLVPSISSSSTVFASVTTEQLTAILSIAVLTLLNCFGIRLGAWVQNIFTFTKTAALLALALLVFFLGSSYQGFTVNFGDFWRNADWSVSTLTLLAVAMVGPLFASDAWYGVTFTGAEIKNPRRNLPLSMIVGVGTVSVLYIMINFVYLGLLPLEGSPDGVGPIARGIQYASEDRVGTAAAQVIFGPQGVGLMALFIMISVFGCNNGLILSGARVYYAMARDNLFFSAVGRVHPRYHTPVVSLVVQGVWASVLTLSGTYSQLLDYIIFAVLLFLMLTIAGLFVLRRKRPEMERPYRTWGYPVLPILYLVLAGFIEVNLLIYKPEYTWPGLIIVLLGLPVYYLWRRFSGSQSVRQ
ncbi:MAG: amino acid permease [Acidobacteria bacterium]|nr:amino acid permease [Acidobacteriota bacterium]